MMATSPRVDPFRASYAVPVAGGRLHVARAGPAPDDAEAVVLAVHGITASHVAWRGAVRALLERTDACVLAPDLRGRGRSAQLPPHDRFHAHVDDLVAVLDRLGVERALLAGHSMGAYVVARVAADHPGRASGVVLVDGGLPLPPLREDDDPDEVLEKTLGPALARLPMTFESAERYVEFWRRHPAFRDAWNDDIDAYARADLTSGPGPLRSVTSEAAARVDGTALLLDEPTRTALERVHAPIQLLRAPRGLLDDEKLMISDSVLEDFLAKRPDVYVELVEDVNHYTLLMGAGAPRVAAAIARGLAAGPSGGGGSARCGQDEPAGSR
jgi:pimeloyl-ACP methyl ester carboxylesterase